MEDKLEKVIAEIERRKKLHEDSLINPIHEGFGLQNVIKAKISELTYLSSFIDSIQKEPKECMYSTANYTNADRLTLCKDCEELCKYNQKTAAESLWAGVFCWLFCKLEKYSDKVIIKRKK